MGTEKKIVLFGLAESGKSTIIKIIQEGKLPSKNERFLPTIDFNKVTLFLDGSEMTFFDLGGCTAFLDRFTGELSEFIFSEVKALVFVVDSIAVQSISRAKYYLDLSLKKLDQYSPEASVVIFQHKIDLIPKKLREEVYHTLKDYLLKGINKKIFYYETSIFTCSFVIAMSAVYQLSLGYIPNNWLVKI